MVCLPTAMWVCNSAPPHWRRVGQEKPHYPLVGNVPTPCLLLLDTTLVRRCG